VPVGVDIVRVESAADMEAAVMPRAADFDVVVMAAAVADFRPKAVADRKIKKGDGLSDIILEPTHDFLVDLGRLKRPGQLIVGFAAETNDVLANAHEKLARKNLDIIVANDVGAPEVGFAHDTNAVTIITADGLATAIPLADKRVIADAICDAIVTRRTSISS
jgi:phosphopantothenoylcysteine decarboxylase/phosphopantothenate--cysteine ligase